MDVGRVVYTSKILLKEEIPVNLACTGRETKSLGKKAKDLNSIKEGSVINLAEEKLLGISDLRFTTLRRNLAMKRKAANDACKFHTIGAWTCSQSYDITSI